jgi:hypothetical protein
MNKQCILSVDNMNQSLVHTDGDPPRALVRLHHRRPPLAKALAAGLGCATSIIAANGIPPAASALPMPRPHRTTPRHPEFSRHQGIYCVAPKKSRTEKSLNLPSGRAMSSRRLFLSGLLSSRARLRLAGLIILPTPTVPKLQSTYFATTPAAALIPSAIAPTHANASGASPLS